MRPGRDASTWDVLTYSFDNLPDSDCAWIAFFFLLQLGFFFTLGYLFERIVPKYYNTTFLTEDARVEWRNRMVSSIHAAASFFAALIILLSNPDLRRDPIFATSTPSRVTLCLTAGYLLADNVMMLHHKHLYAHAMLAHHNFALFGIFIVLGMNMGHFFGMYLITTEASTPFVNAVYYLQQCKQDHSFAFKVNGATLTFVWLFARVLNIPYYWYVAYDSWSVLKEQHWIVVLVMAANGVLLGCLNTYWFFLILKGMIAAIRGQSAYEKDLETIVHEMEGNELDEMLMDVPRRAYVAIREESGSEDDFEEEAIEVPHE
jgi:hypothetical protein